MAYITRSFTEKEFACPCCGQCDMDPKFMVRLQSFRDMLDIPFSPVKGGGYRCASYNGSATGSHVEGKAVDPDFGKEHYHAAMYAAMYHKFTGIGLKQKGKFQFHMDTAKNIPGVRPRPWVWTY